jgi:phosphoglycerate kinase
MNYYKAIRCQLDTLSFYGQRIFLRADLNIPLEQGKIIDDYRLLSLLPTIDLIAQKGGKIILATHIGRPTAYEASLSTQHLIAWFCTRGYHIDFAENPDQAIIKSREKNNAIILLENLRFFYGEQHHEKEFAHLLAASADFYVNDAFGLVHRNDTSITLLPLLFPPQKRTIGLLIEKELRNLDPLIEKPARPYIALIGGSKISTKLPLLEGLLEHVDTICLCPALVFTFLQASGEKVGKSLIDDLYRTHAQEIILRAQELKKELLFPLDYQIAKNTFDGSLSSVDANAIPSDSIGISIGPKTIEQWGIKIVQARTVFYNGLMGFIERPDTLAGARSIFHAMADSDGYSVLGGGDTVAAAQALGYGDKVDFLSTGGGATLAYIAGQKLPGLEPFLS